MQKTFGTKDSQNWLGARFAFEQDLIEKDISWFDIKFYIDKDEAIKPLVISKTCSKLVNTNGTDVSFSIDENNVPARKFLKEQHLEWNKIKILIILCENKIKSLEIEKQISIKYNLFES